MRAGVKRIMLWSVENWNLLAAGLQVALEIRRLEALLPSVMLMQVQEPTTSSQSNPLCPKRRQGQRDPTHPEGIQNLIFVIVSQDTSCLSSWIVVAHHFRLRQVA